FNAQFTRVIASPPAGPISEAAQACYYGGGPESRPVTYAEGLYFARLYPELASGFATSSLAPDATHPYRFVRVPGDAPEGGLAVPSFPISYLCVKPTNPRENDYLTQEKIRALVSEWEGVA